MSKYLDNVIMSCPHCQQNVQIFIDSTVDDWDEAEKKEEVYCPECKKLIMRLAYS